MPQRVRIALIADIHHGPAHQSKDGARALELLDRFLEFVRQARPDFIVDLGDRINDQGREEDLRLEAEVAARFKSLDIPRVHLLGNHDRAFLSPQENSEALGSSLHNHSFDLNGWHFTVWQADARYKPGDPDGLFYYEQEELSWLEGNLALTDLPTVIFSHLPIVPSRMAGNWYFEERFASGTTFHNWQQARRIVRESGKVPLAVAGHVHWNSLQTTDGTIYLTQQSLTEQFVTGRTAEAWGMLELHPDRLEWEVYGHEWIKLSLPLLSLNLSQGGGHESRLTAHAD